jgi:ADP-L-glycero-D-manno-heptose 6-epimerase
VGVNQQGSLLRFVKACFVSCTQENQPFLEWSVKYMKSILVTGGAGFIGSNLVAELNARGTHNIVVCDTLGNNDKWRNLAKHAVAEIITPEYLFYWLESNHQNLEMIYHLGAISSTVEKNLDLVIQHNFSLSLKIWRWATANNVRMLYTSSSAVYGDGSQGFEDVLDAEYMSRLRPLSGYGWSKQLFDIHVANSHKLGEFPHPQWVGLRLFNAYGPNEYHKEDQRSVLSKIAVQVVQSAAVRLFRSYNPQYPDGGQQRDVIYVKDCARVMAWFLDHPEISGLFNLGTGQACSFNDMAKALFKSVKREPNIHYFDMPPSLVSNYQYFTQANIERLRAAGYTQAFTSLEEGVNDYIQNYLTKADHYR